MKGVSAPDEWRPSALVSRRQFWLGTTGAILSAAGAILSLTSAPLWVVMSLLILGALLMVIGLIWSSVTVLGHGRRA